MLSAEEQVVNLKFGRKKKEFVLPFMSLIPLKKNLVKD